MIKELYYTERIQAKETYEWLLKKHYAHRIPSIMYAFGLRHKDTRLLVAVMTFGMPASPSLSVGVFGRDSDIPIYELNRLCAQDGLPRNALSYFVSSALKMLPRNIAIVSYADTGQHHHGYIYQATNWIYTGLSSPHKEYEIKGMENKHCRHIGDNIHLGIEELQERYGKENVIVKERSRKHRYFMFIGNKRERKLMERLLQYPPQPYPKGDNKRYDASYTPTQQLTLF